MRTGSLDKRITFQTPINTSDGMGGFTLTWDNRATVWAALWPVSAKESVQGAKSTEEITHRIRIRFRNDIATDQRIQFGNRYFNITGIINQEEKNELLDILACEVAK